MTRYGAYKTPGGKLIAVEFAVEDGVLRHVVVSGDFFLYPEEALGSLAGALLGRAGTGSNREHPFTRRILVYKVDQSSRKGRSPRTATSGWRGRIW